MKDSYKARKQEIYDSYEPVRESKRKFISKIVALGMGKGRFRYALMILIVPYSFFCNLFLHMVMGFQMHKKHAKAIAVGMALILSTTSLMEVMQEKSYAVSSDYVNVTTPDLGGKIVHAALYSTVEFLDYELDLICDGRTYRVYSGLRNVKGHASNNYVFTTEDSSVNINEQFSYIVDDKTLDFTEIVDDSGQFYLIKGSNSLNEVVVATVKRKSGNDVKYITYDKFGPIPAMGKIIGKYTKKLSELGINGVNPKILAHTATYYFNSAVSASGTADFDIYDDEVTLNFLSHSAPAGDYGWGRSGVYIAFEQNKTTEKTDVYEVAPGAARSIYVREGDELTITIRTTDGRLITEIHEVITEDSGRELVIDEVPKVLIEDKEYTAEPFNGLSSVLASYVAMYSGRNGTVYESEEPPIEVGEYTVHVEMDEEAKDLDFKITPAPLTITATDQNIMKFDVVTGRDAVEVIGLKGSDELSSVDITLSTYDVTEEGTVTPSNAVIKNAGEERTHNYDITYESGNLVITAADPVIRKLPKASAIIYGQSLFDSVLKGGKADVPGTFVWKNKEIKPDVADSNTTYYDIIFIPDDKANYNCVEAQITVPVKPKRITEEMADINEGGSYEYTGNEITPLITVTDGDEVLGEDEYFLSGDIAHTKYGKHKVKINGTGNYTGTVRLEWNITDTVMPEGMIEISDDSWDDFQEGTGFEIFYNKAQKVIITASDNESGIEKIDYIISDKALSGSEVADTPEYKWIPIKNKGSFSIKPDSKIVVYARISDKAGNTAYISSDGVVLDAVPPVITGVEQNHKYCFRPTVTITDSNLSDVYFNGKRIVLNNGTYELPANEVISKIVAKDKAGNVTEVKKFIVYKGHSFTHYVSNNDATTEKNATETALCDHGCGASDTREIPDSMIKKGNIKVDYNIDENVPKTEINNLDKDMAYNLLNKQEADDYNYGKDVKVYLNIEKLKKSKNELIKAVNNLNDGYVINEMLDITLYKQMSNNGIAETPVKITDTEGKPISITIKVPEQYIRSGQYRNFGIVRLHDDKVDLLDTVYDEETGTITFESDKFSAYALVSTEIEEPEDIPSGDLFDPRKWLIAILISLGLICLTVPVDLKKTVD